MRNLKKNIAVLMALVLFLTFTLSGCKDVGGFFRNLFSKHNNQKVTTEAVLPDRPYIIDEGDKEPTTVAEYLEKPIVKPEEILNNQEFESQILAATRLDEIANSKTEVDNLRNLAMSLKSLQTDTSKFSDALNTKILTLSTKIDSLFEMGNGVLEQIKTETAFKGTWTKEDKVILRWNPQKEWIPDDGYKLFRIIDGNSELIAEGLGTEQFIDKAAQSENEFSKYIKDLYVKSIVTPEVLKEVGVTTKEQFNELAYKDIVVAKNTYRFSGKEDFERMKTNTFSIKESLVERVPLADAYSENSIHLQSNISALPSALNAVKSINNVSIKNNGKKLTTVQERVIDIMDNRNSILTIANTDVKFANAAGFGYEDNLKGKKIAKNTKIEYILVPQKPSLKLVNLAAISSKAYPEGVYSIKVTYGVETPFEDPKDLEGYGADNKVYFRWSTPQTQYGKSIISGYNIERKKKGESKYTKLNNSPIAVSYIQDEDGIYYEAPAFYIDTTLVNGDEATYRVQAIDIFGRISNYTNELDITVYKVTPPKSPSLEQPTLSVSKTIKASEYVLRSFTLNEGKTGMVLPISKTSDDTTSFIIYRSQALGNNKFDAPVKVTEIPIKKLTLNSQTNKIIKQDKIKMIIKPDSTSQIDSVYFDSGVQPGYYYKYWVASVDQWGNESPWSTSRVVAYPTDVSPTEPNGLSATVIHNTDASKKPVEIPGFMSDRLINTNTLSIDKNSSDFSKTAIENSIEIGKSISTTIRNNFNIVPTVISSEFSNLPAIEDIHDIVALSNDDILSGGTAMVSWYHYAGEGLKGYDVYRTYVDDKSLEEIKTMSRKEIVEAYSWNLVSKNITENQISDAVEQKDNRTYLYLIFLVSDSSGFSQLPGFDVFLPGGWIKLKWANSDDPQFGYYRVYKAEVPYFVDETIPDNLVWTLVKDHQKFNGHLEKINQTFAHYYYYKVTSVSLWGKESEVGDITRVRVPATSPPQTPVMLLPFAQKGQVEIQFAGVTHASKYTIFRLKLPKIEEVDIEKIKDTSNVLFEKMFNPAALSDNFISQQLTSVNFSLVNNVKTITEKTTIPLADKFNTVQLEKKADIINSISQVGDKDKISLYQTIENKYGVLALTPYGQLSREIAKSVIWNNVGEINIAQGDPSTGVFKFTDKDVEYGDTYLYTVQASNDDNLYSGRPDPVTVAPRRNQAFPPVNGVSGTIDPDTDLPLLTWNAAKEPNLSWEKSRENIAGYIVYKSTSENGTYYQASALLTDTKFIDRRADKYAANWYKVKVVDTGGYISDFSVAVKIQKVREFIIPKTNLKNIIPKITIPNYTGQLNKGNVTETAFIPITPITPIIPNFQIVYTINGYEITGLSSDTLNAGYGPGVLHISEELEVDVNVTIRVLEGTTIVSGFASLIQPVAFDDAGIYFSDLKISTSTPESVVSGYVLSTKNENLIGDLYSLRFNDAIMDTKGVIRMNWVPNFHYSNLTFRGAQMVTINLANRSNEANIGGMTIFNPNLYPLIYRSSFITIINGYVENNLGMETLDNKGLKMSYGMVGFDKEGNLSGTFATTNTQVVRAVIPAGLGIKVTSSTLNYDSGQVNTSTSTITGKVILPFDTFEDSLPVELDTNMFLTTYSKIDKNVVKANTFNDIIKIKPSNNSLSLVQKDVVDKGMYYLATRIQANSLKVLPMDISIQEKLSSVPFNVTTWNGKGFMVEETTMTPALVGKANEEIGITPGKVALDLSKTETYSGKAPDDTKAPGWMGIVVKNGRVGLPSAYIKTDNDTRVLFNLSEGELLYDRNGIFYQNQAYSAEGIPVNLGDELGGFKDVTVNLIYLDMYNNKVNLEIQGRMGVPLFGYQQVNIRLYTSKELGKLVCSVAETDKFDPSGDGKTYIKILGGHLQKDGLHMDGTLDLKFDGKLTKENMQFTELIIPSDMDLMTVEGNVDKKYGVAVFDKPYRVTFHDFEMDVKEMSFVSTKDNISAQLLTATFKTGHKHSLVLSGNWSQNIFTATNVPFYKTSLTLWGGMQLSDNLAMNSNEDFDRIVIGNTFTNPTISYNESKSKMDLDYEEFVKVQAVVVPKTTSGDDGIIEYDTDSIEMAFNSASNLASPIPIKVNMRLGYDKLKERYFFAIGMYYHDPLGGIRFGIASLNDITGVIGYNLDLNYDDDGFVFPQDKDGFFQSIDTLAVNRTDQGNYFFAATAWMYLGYDAGGTQLSLGEIRNIYFVVEKGPTIEMGGEYYGPSDLSSLLTGKNLKLMGKARLGYYHQERLFKFSISLYDFGMYGFTINGDLGFEMCPQYWELRVGYPRILEGSYGGLIGGFGLDIRDSDLENDSYIKAKMKIGYDTGDITVAIVYFRGYVIAGGEGEYYFDSGTIILKVYIEGGIEGGIKVAGHKYNIISLMLGADGTLTRYESKWNLDGNVNIHYHLDLFLLEVGGSAHWHMSQDF